MIALGNRTTLFPALLLVAACLTGCDDQLASRDDFDRPFSLFGVLSPDLDTQSVRLYLPEAYPTLGSAGPLPVDFTSTDLKTGNRRSWRDSTLEDPNGQIQHIFWAPFRAEFGHTYHVEAVRRDDGARSYTDVHIPPRVSVRIDESDAPLLHIFVEGEGIRALKPEAVYDVSKGPPLLRFKVAYEGQEEPAETGWRVTFNMVVDAYEVNMLYNGIAPSLGGICRIDYVFLHHLELHVIVGDSVWNPPGGVFDPNVLSNPKRLSNVTNGFGFVGGGFHVKESLHPSRQTVESACFRYGF